MKVLKVDCSKFTEEQLFTLEEITLETNFEGIDSVVSFEDKTLIFSKRYEGSVDTINSIDKKLSFHDYLEPGKFTKKFLLDNKLIDNEKDNSLFSLVDVEIKLEDEITKVDEVNWDLVITKTADLSKFIYKVPENDPHLVDALSKLNKIKRNKLN